MSIVPQTIAKEDPLVRKLTTEDKVYVYPVPRKSIQKRHEYINKSSGKHMNKNKAKRAFTLFSVSLSLSRNVLNTGLWNPHDNPWYGQSVEDLGWLPEGYDPTIVAGSKRLTRQAYLEIKHGRKRGFYDPDPGDIFSIEKGKSYIQNFRYPLMDTANVLDRKDPRQELAFFLFLASDKIANSYDDIIPGITEFYISRVNESEERLSQKNRIIAQGIAKFYELIQERGPREVKRVGLILGLISEDVTNEKAENELYSFVFDSKKQQENIAKLLELLDLYDVEGGFAKLQAKEFACKLIANRVISDKNGKYRWVQAPSNNLEVLGRTEDEFISFLLDPDSKPYREMLIEQYEAAKL